MTIDLDQDYLRPTLIRFAEYFPGYSQVYILGYFADLRRVFQSNFEKLNMRCQYSKVIALLY